MVYRGRPQNSAENSKGQVVVGSRATCTSRSLVRFITQGTCQRAINAPIGEVLFLANAAPVARNPTENVWEAEFTETLRTR
jgi:hypothetical protein